MRLFSDWSMLCEQNRVHPLLALGPSTKKVLVGIVPSLCQAEAIMHRLESENFQDSRISVIFPDTTALALPGLGPFIAAGPIVEDLQASADCSSAGIAEGLIGLRIPAAKAERCHNHLKKGKFLLSVHVESDAEFELARKIFASLGTEAVDICCPGEGELNVA